MEILGYVLTGGVAAAAIKLLESIITWKLNRKATIKDKSATKQEKVEFDQQQDIEKLQKDIKTLKAGQMIILYDRIKYLARCHIAKGEISFEDREDLIKIHDAYHGDGGNGNLDSLMQQVKRLPLKG